MSLTSITHHLETETSAHSQITLALFLPSVVFQGKCPLLIFQRLCPMQNTRVFYKYLNLLIKGDPLWRDA